MGSVLIPKLLGSYEQELQPLLQRLAAQNYSEIVDIGCAEGYYAIGLGGCFPRAKFSPMTPTRKESGCAG